MKYHEHPAELYPPIEFVRDEMNERGWSDDDLIAASGATETTDRATIELFLAIGDPREVGYTVIMNRHLAGLLGKAFGTSASFWLKLDESYREWRRSYQ